ncbi:hypothetical protein [Cryobacterium sp. N19]|uniref:hypothetical protein n=1 Tax=Cryobacterium sp. N19 TaxID=2048288 RepID=UPI001304C766|nr:hypothetical protein [Cryobacterium sp. N19]
MDEILVRLFPGGVERPIADVDRALRVAAAVDRPLKAKLGFGIQDLLMVVLTHIDDDLKSMAPAWPIADSDEPLGTLSEAEITAAVVAIAQHEAPTGEGEQRALAWLTAEAEHLEFEPGHPQSPFGSTMLVRVPGEPKARWMPLSLLPEMLTYAVGELACSVSGELGVAGEFARSTAALVRQKLWRFGSLIIGSPDTPAGPSVVIGGNNIQWILTQGAQRALVVQVQSTLEGEMGALEWEEPAVLGSSETVRSGAPQRLPNSLVTIPQGAEVVPLLIVSTADHIMTPSGSGLTSMSMDDFTWISSSAKSGLDLYNFARDMARADLPHYFGFETIDAWEWWVANGKSFFSGGLGPTFMSIAPHGGSAEWERGADLTVVERALAALGFPGTREWDIVERSGRMPANVLRWRAGPGDFNYSGSESVRPGSFERGALEAWSVGVSEVPCAVMSASELWSREASSLLHDLAGAITFGIRAIEKDWGASLGGVGVAAVAIELQPAPDSLGGDRFISARCHTLNAGSIGDVLKVSSIIDCDGLMNAGDGKPDVLRLHMGWLIEDILKLGGVATDLAARARLAWNAAPPTLTIDLLSTPTARNELAPPVEIDLAYKSTAERLVSTRLRELDVRPGVYRGDDAKLLDRTALAPIALELLEEQLVSFAMSAVVVQGMVQLERTLDRRDILLRNIRRSARELELDWDPIEQYEEAQSEHIELRRANEVLVEAALRTAPAGMKTIDDLAWGELLAVANVYLDATTRSENVHHQVQPLAIEVSNSYEVRAVPDRKPDTSQGSRIRYDLDLQSFSRAIARESFDIDGVNMTPVSEQRRQEVNAAMLNAFGSTPEDIFTVLHTLAQWRFQPEDNDATTSTLAEVETFLCESTVLGEDPVGAARLRAALGMLISTSKDMKSEDWKPWHARTRKRRLLAQPVPMLPNGQMVISPHYLMGALSMYRSYLEQGLLPWTQPQAPGMLETALNNFRDTKNMLFERDVAREMTANGWSVLTNIKETKPERLNLATLNTEIDVVAGKVGERTIWILEAKDPATVHATPEIRRSLDNFELDGSKPSYSTQLSKKLADLKPNAAQVAQALALPVRSSENPYEVRARFVTRHPVPAAFISGEFQFSTLSTLLADIAADAAGTAC